MLTTKNRNRDSNKTRIPDSGQPIMQKSSLKVSDKNDVQEKEANAVAEKVMLMPDRVQPQIPLSHKPQNRLHLTSEDRANSITLQPEEQENDESLQMMPDIQPDIMSGNPEDSEKDDTLTPKSEHPVTAETIQTKKEEEKEAVNLKEEEEESIQQKEDDELAAQSDDEDKLLTKSNDEESVQAQTEDDDNVLQAKLHLKEDDELSTQPEEESEEESVQTKPIHRKEDNSSRFASKDIESSLNRTKGQGNSLPEHTQSDIGSKMGADFSQIRIHTDSTAHEMNAELNAKAFTHGNDIYFKSGEYNPGSSQGKRLITHELTHTIQQGASSKLQPKEEANTVTASPDQENNAVLADNTTSQEPVSPENQPTQETTNPPGNNGNQIPSETPDEEQEQQTPNIREPNNEAQQAKNQVLEEKTKTQEQKKEGEKGDSAALGELKEKEGDKKEENPEEEEGKESERLTDMVAPEMDGGAERLAKENEENLGTISQDLTDKSAKKTRTGISKIGTLATNEQKKEDVGTKLQQIDEAVEEKPEDKKAEVQSDQVTKVDAIKPPETKTDQPKQKLRKEMEDALPETIEDVDKFKDRGKGVHIGNQVSTIVNQETSKVESTYQEIEKTKEPEKPKESTPVGDIESPVETGKLNVGKGLVPEVEEQVTDLSEYSNESDKLLEREGIPEENLEMVDSGDLAEAKAERKSIKEKSETSPKEVKEFEKKEIKGVEKDLQKQEESNKGTMRKQREKGLKDAREDQKKTKSKIEKEREKVTKKINGIYEKANKDVKQKLSDLETKSLNAFDKEQSKASQTFENNVKKRIDKFKKKRYSGKLGFLKKGKDWLMGIDDFPEIKEIFNSEKSTFITTIDKAISDIIDKSQKVIKECKDIITKARTDIDEYVKGLKPALQKTGEQAQKEIKEKLDKLDKEVDKAAEKLKEKLQEKREAAIKEIEKKIEKMKEEMSGALSKLGKLLLDAALKFFKWALEKAGYSTKQIMGIINKGKAVITKIVTDPKGFFKNLGKGIGLGFKNFVKNIKKHLIKGLIDWLTGSLGDTGIVLPKTWNLRGIFSLFLQIMGLSYTFLRGRLVKYVGEPVVAAAEGTFEMIKNIRKEGPIALWKWIKEKAAEIKQTIFEGIRNWVITQVVKKAIIKLVSMLNPAGAIVQAILTIYDVVMFFIDNWDRIVETVKTIFSTISDIAYGKIGFVAKKVESIMAMTIPMIISFLARFLGLSGLAKVIQKLIKKVRQPVVKIVDKAAKWIAKKIKKIAGKVKKFGKKVKKKIKGGIEKLIQWWKVKKSFKAKDGSKHKVYSKKSGKGAKVYIASEETPVEVFLKKKMGKETDPANQALIKSALGYYQKEVNNAKTEVEKAETKYRKETEKKAKRAARYQYQKTVEGFRGCMKSFAEKLSLINIEEETNLNIRTKIKNRKKGDRASSVTAWPLTYLPGKYVGSPPSEDPPGFDYTKDATDKWVRGHLLSEHLHGPGLKWNLVPISQATNSQMESYENKVKPLIDKQGNLLYYIAVAGYDDSRTNIDEKSIPTSIRITWGKLQKDPGKQDKFKPLENHNEPVITQGLPVFGGPPNLNNVGDRTLMRLGVPERLVKDIMRCKNNFKETHGGFDGLNDLITMMEMFYAGTLTPKEGPYPKKYLTKLSASHKTFLFKLVVTDKKIKIE